MSLLPVVLSSLSLLSSSLLYTNQIIKTCQIQNTRLIIEQGDITQSNVKAVTNAANPQLLAGAGVCSVIFEKAGLRELQAACYQYVADQQGIRCPIGQIRITQSFGLQTRGIDYIIHAVGPDCRVVTDMNEQDRLLRQTYISILHATNIYHINSVAIPFISSGIYGFNKQRAAKIALDTTNQYIKDNPNSTLKSVHFVLFSHEDVAIFSRALQQLPSMPCEKSSGGFFSRLKETISSFFS